MAKPRKGKIVAINAGDRSRRANRRGSADTLPSRTGDQSDDWSELVDTFAGFVWTSARAGQLRWRETEDVFRIAWLRFADHFTDVPDDAVEVWLQQTVVRERARITALRTGRLG